MYLLDTNVVSEFRRLGEGRGNSAVAEWQSAIAFDSMFLSVTTLMELEIGVLLMERRDARQGAILRAWLDGRVMSGFAGRILPGDAAVALRCATLHVPDPRPERDALIAATALVHGMTVVTRNVADFAPMGVTVIGPWAA